MGLTGQVLIKAAQRAEATTGHQVSEGQREEGEPPDGSGRTYWQEIRFGSRSVYGQKRISFVPNSWKLKIFHSFLSDSLHSTIFKYNALIVTSTNSQLITLIGLRFTNAAEVKRHKLLPDSFPWTFALSGVKGHLCFFQLNMLTYPLIVYSAALCEALPPLMTESPLSKWHRAQSSATDLVLANRSASMWWHCCRKERTSRTLKDTLLPSKFACMWITTKLALCRVFHTCSGTCAVLILWIHTDLFCCWFKHWCKKCIFCLFVFLWNRRFHVCCLHAVFMLSSITTVWISAEVNSQLSLFNLHFLIGMEYLLPEQYHCKAFISRSTLQQGQVGSHRWRLSEPSDLAHQTYGWLIEMG